MWISSTRAPASSRARTASASQLVPAVRVTMARGEDMLGSTLEAGLVGGAQGVDGQVDEGSAGRGRVRGADLEPRRVCDAADVGQGQVLEAGAEVVLVLWRDLDDPARAALGEEEGGVGVGGVGRVFQLEGGEAQLGAQVAGEGGLGGGDGEDRLLESCYRSCLALAAEKDIRSIAFPAISTGIYGFPRARAARIAVATTRDFLAAPAGLPERIVFVSFSAADHDIMAQALAEPG